MAYITNELRNKTIRKLDRGNGGRKFVIAIALLSGILLGVFVLLGILGQMNITNASSHLQFIDTTKKGINMVTWMGWICFVLLFFTLFFGFLGFFFTITMVSAKNASHTAVKLSRIALSGKKNSKNVSRDVKSRVTATR